MLRWALVFLICGFAVAQTNLVPNGDFERDENGDGVPDAWTVIAPGFVKWQLTRDVGRDGNGFSGKLICTDFPFDKSTPAHRIVVCQTGTISVQRDRWYRLSFWAKAEGIRYRDAFFTLVNTRIGLDVGLSEIFTPTDQWQHYEVYFKAERDTKAEESRLEFGWNRSTGTLWLDDVELVEIPELSPRRLPQIPTEGVVNFLPNSSFECGTAGWGSYAPELSSAVRMGNVFQLIGELDDKTSAHGRFSLKVTLSEPNLPTFYFDWFDPIRQPVRSIVVAHHGWVTVNRGQPYTLSAFMKADRPNVVGVLFVRQSDGRNLSRNFTLTTDWQRYSFTFAPQADFIWVGAGLDLNASKMSSATVWLDAMQLEQGSQASEYRPRLQVEVMASTDETGNIFVVERGQPTLPIKLHAFADGTVEGTGDKGQGAREVTATISVRDFFDREVLRQTVRFAVPVGKSIVRTVNFPVGKFGFYRVQVTTPEKANFCLPLRCAVIKPYRAKDSRWGMNHAYPWQFLLRLAHRAGILWWRDWSVQWRTVQPKPDANFNFSEPDFQIDRVVEEGGNCLIIFPQPSADWVSEGSPKIEEYALYPWQRKRMLLACKPKDEQAFARYIAESIRHYRTQVTAYQIFNEVLFTPYYALPTAFGYTIEDYLRLLRIAHELVKSEAPNAIVVGGTCIWARSPLAREFVEKGGMRFVDVLDMHLYTRESPERLSEELRELRKLMEKRNEAKPMWMTEIGCYADDDPPMEMLRYLYGDVATRRAFHPSEREASEWLVKFASLFFANGGEKIFLHAGTCGEINGVDTGGVFFEYGGTPRKMLVAVAAMANLIPPEAKFERSEKLSDGVIVHWFRVGKKRVGVAWSADGKVHQIALPSGVSALDIMGNPIEGRKVAVSETPIYLTQ